MRSPALTLAGSLVAMLLAACGDGSGQNAETPAEAAPAPPATQEALSIGRWRVEVSVSPTRLGPIAFAARDLARAKPASSDPWIRHELVFRNTGNRPVTFADTRGSEFTGEAGHDRLLVADEGCGHARNHPRAPATAGACLRYFAAFTVEPEEAARRSITLFKGLPGLDKLAAGTYVFRRPVRFQLGRRPPGEGRGRAGVIRVVYEVAVRSP